MFPIYLSKYYGEYLKVRAETHPQQVHNLFTLFRGIALKVTALKGTTRAVCTLLSNKEDLSCWQDSGTKKSYTIKRTHREPAGPF